jgi:hypothetical protein
MTCAQRGFASTRRSWDDVKKVWMVAVTTPAFSCGVQGKTTTSSGGSTRTYEEQPSSKYPAPTKRTALSFDRTPTPGGVWQSIRMQWRQEAIRNAKPSILRHKPALVRWKSGSLLKLCHMKNERIHL